MKNQQFPHENLKSHVYLERSQTLGGIEFNHSMIATSSGNWPTNKIAE